MAVTRRRRIFQIAVWNIGVVLGLLVVAELIFGSWLSEESLGSLAIKRDIHDLHDVSELYPHDEPVEFIRDRHGLRGAYGAPSDVTILAIGGSTTNERWVSEDKTWTHRLGRKLAEAGTPHVIANAGHDGHSSVAHIRSLEDWFPKVPGLAPKYMLVYVGINDVGVSPDAIRQEDPLAYADLSRRIRKFITNNSALVRLVTTIRGHIAARRLRVVHESGVDWTAKTWIGTPETVALPEGHAARLAAFSERLAILNKRIRNFGSTPIYVSQIRCGARLVDGERLLVEDPSEVHAHLELMAFGDAMLRFCEAEGEMCVPLHREFAFEPGDCYDYVHTTDVGAAALSDYFFERLKGLP